MTEHRKDNGKSRVNPVIVVGVDGSAGAKEALRWALDEGRLRKWPVRAVHAWTLGYLFNGSVEGYPYWGGPGAYVSNGVDLSGLHRAAEDLLEQALAEIEDHADGVEIDRQVVQGSAAEILISETTPGDLLVVGSRGHGGFVGLLLGSVSLQCVHHARCPVVVVHAPKQAAVGDDTLASVTTEGRATS
jgi:nucleotide-binding universal stress UspA family protein